jgi:Fe-S cluster assembly iron-binding protein IscA
MALDGAKEDDETFEDQGLTFVMESALYEKVKPVTVEYVSTPMGAGFQIASSLAKTQACGSSCSTNNACSC